MVTTPLPIFAAAALLLSGSVALAQVQSTRPSHSAPRAPGVTRAVEHPDTSGPDRSGPDPTVDQPQPDPHQPETASDKPTPPSSSEKAAAIAREGVRSNTPPPRKPPKG